MTDVAADPATVLDRRIWVAWLTVRGARVVADTRPDPENLKTRDRAEHYLDTLLDARLQVLPAAGVVLP